MSYATKDDFFAATKRRFRDVTLWSGKKARIRSLTEAEYAEIDAKNIDHRKGGLSLPGIRSSNARLVAACVCDAEGERIFLDSDVERLSAVDAALIEPLVREIREHCGLQRDAEDLRKNLPGTDGGCSNSSSAEQSLTA
jgi:hypothetical protein